MKKIIYHILTVGFILLIFSCSEGKRFELLSPDGIYKLNAYSQELFIKLEIYSKNGDILFNKQTNISSFHRWSVEWYNNEKFLLKSSDVGDSFWVRIDDHNWEEKPANRAVSPDGKLIVDAYFAGDQIDSKIVQLAIGSLGYKGSMKITFEIPTKVEVITLVDCVAWESADIISLKGVKKKHYWERQEDGSWQKLER